MPATVCYSSHQTTKFKIGCPHQMQGRIVTVIASVNITTVFNKLFDSFCIARFSCLEKSEYCWFQLVFGHNLNVMLRKAQLPDWATRNGSGSSQADCPAWNAPRTPAFSRVGCAFAPQTAGLGPIPSLHATRSHNSMRPDHPMIIRVRVGPPAGVIIMMIA